MKRGRKLGIPASLSDIVRLEKGDTRNTTSIEQLSNAIDIKRELREFIRTVDGDELFMVPTTVIDPTATDVTLMFGKIRVHLFEYPELVSWEAAVSWQTFGVPALPKEDQDVNRALTKGPPTACTGVRV